MHTLRHLTLTGLLLGVVLLASGLLQTAAAASAVTCHCFRERTFSPGEPTAFDPYLLATVQNRLLAYTFALPRKEIVSSKMAGMPGARLWVVHWLAQKSDVPPDQLLQQYQQEADWRAVVVGTGADPERLGPLFLATLVRESSEEQLANAVVTQVLERTFQLAAARQADLRSAGADTRELILVAALAELTGATPESLLGKALAGGSWGALLAEAGVSVAEIDACLARLSGGSGPPVAPASGNTLE